MKQMREIANLEPVITCGCSLLNAHSVVASLRSLCVLNPEDAAAVCAVDPALCRRNRATEL